MDKVHEFIGQIIDEKGMTDLEPEIREQMIEEMSTLLMQQIDNAAINALSEEKAIELADGLEDGSIKQEDVSKFMTDAGLNLEEISLMTMIQFRDLYLGRVSAPDPEEDNAPTEALNVAEAQ